MPEVLVTISSKSVLKAALTILLVGVCAWLLFLLRDKLIILFLATFVSIVIDPTVHFLEQWKLPRGMAVILVYFVFLAIIIFLVASLIPIVAMQLQDLARLISESSDNFFLNPQVSLPFLPESYNQMLTNLMQVLLQDLDIRDRASALSQFGEQLSQTASSFIAFGANVAGSIVNFFFTLVLVLVLAFFMQMEKEKIREYIRFLFPRSYRMYIDHKVEAVYHKMSLWIRGQLILCLSIGTLVFIALMILGMQEYALTLALLAGFTEFIPVAGPIIAAIPAVLIAVTQQGWAWGLIVAAVYYAVQWSENNLLVPLIMKRAVGLSAIAILFAMLVGVSFPQTIHPILGIILAVPVTTIIAIFVADWQEMRKRD